MDEKYKVLLEAFLSKEPDKILSASHEVRNISLSERDTLEKLADHIEEFKEAAEGLDFGGMFAPNSRFVWRAWDILETAKRGECLCKYTLNEAAPNGKYLAEKYGFIVLKDAYGEKYITKCMVECPLCHQKYEVCEEYTGGFTNSHWCSKID